MNQLELTVNDNKLAIINDTFSTSGSSNFDICNFTFGPMWSGFQKIAVFGIGDDDGYNVVLETDSCKIPIECTQRSGILRIGIIGIGEDAASTIISTNVVTHRITHGVNDGGYITDNIEAQTGFSFDEASQLSTSPAAKISPWADDWYTPKAPDLSQDFFECEFCAMANNYSDYVSEGFLENSTAFYTFTGKDYDRVIVISANHCKKSEMTLSALSGFFKAICEQKESDMNLNFLYNKVKFIVVPTVNTNGNQLNENEVDLSHNYPFRWEECAFEDKGEAGASEPETLAMIGLLNAAAQENLVGVLDFSASEELDCKRIFYPAFEGVDEDVILKTVSKFDCTLPDGDYLKNTVFASSTTPSFTNFAASQFGVNACSSEFKEDIDSVEKYTEYIGNLILSTAKKCRIQAQKNPQPFTKHIFWRSSEDDDVAALNEQMLPVWISSYLTNLLGSYNITLSGYVILKSAAGASVTIRPVLYQQNSAENGYESRFLDSSFDINATICQGISVVPINSVIQGERTSSCPDKKFAQNLGALIAASCEQGQGEIVGFSYTLDATPSNAVNAVEILTPQGLASDYADESQSPVFTLKYPLGGWAAQIIE